MSAGLGATSSSQASGDASSPGDRRAQTSCAIPSSQTITEHTVGPMVGVEGRIRLTDQLVLAPGVRLLAITVAGRDGWLIRPGVGLQWRF